MRRPRFVPLLSDLASSKLKLAGFKTFVDPITVRTSGNLVGIVGPNGCGKSNVIDAMRWVLGETRASALRGESMQGVIFNGSTTRKPVSRASVEQPAGLELPARMPGIRRSGGAGHPLPPIHTHPPLPAWDDSQVTNADKEVVLAHNWAELRQAMWDYVGIVRTNKRLQRARNRIRLRLLAREIEEFYSNFRVSNDLIELRNLVVTADLIVSCALRRHESRGLHYSRDYPATQPRARDTVCTRPHRAQYIRAVQFNVAHIHHA